MNNAEDTIMIVDDERSNYTIFNEILKDKNYNLRFARSGEEALKQVDIENPDLILLDIIMSKMDGYEVLHRLKINEATKNIPVIIITALGEEDEEIKGLELGAVDYIKKPFKPAIVEARVKTHLELKRYREIVEQMFLAQKQYIDTAEEAYRVYSSKKQSAHRNLLEKMDTLKTNLISKVNLNISNGH